MARWYLGFDCATKTFAFSLSRIDFGDIAGARRRVTAARELLRRAAADLRAAPAIVATLRPAIAELERDLDCITLADGGVVDLAPGRADADVSTVERIRALVAYIETRVRPSVARNTSGAPLHVVIEYQMGHNSRARAISAALVALFAADSVIIVSPTLKNRVWLSPEGRYGNFTQKYNTSYGANKAHAIFNFQTVERVFGTQIPETEKKALRGHIADSFMQVLGHIVHGAADGDAARKF